MQANKIGQTDTHEWMNDTKKKVEAKLTIGLCFNRKIGLIIHQNVLIFTRLNVIEP
jgi:hypothetical protein